MTFCVYVEKTKMKNSEFATLIKKRTKLLALQIIQMRGQLPNDPVGWVIGKQLIRSSTSTAANYSAACRARSQAEFFAKLSITLEEADETCFWLELMLEAGMGDENKLTAVLEEALALTKLFASARKTTNKKINPTRP